MFLVVKGRFRMEFRDRHEWIEEVSSSWCREGSSTSPLRMKNAGYCYLSRRHSEHSKCANERTVRELERV